MSSRRGAADAGGAPRLGYRPGLDGIRALAVLAVLAYHNGFSWLPGGFYGVDAFFVLSGFLITSLLVEEWQGRGTLSLGRFWARRARRLLPALFVLIGVVGVVAWLWPQALGTPSLMGDALSTLFYSANWYLIAAHANYFTATAQPSPFLHTWSLAIEEQFYLLWPLIVLAVLAGRRRLGRRVPVVGGDRRSVLVELPGTGAGAWVRRRGLGRRGADAGGVERLPRVAPTGDERVRRLLVLLVLSVAGALASALWMGWIASTSDTDRAYYGTDTRAQALLVGSALAAALALWGTARNPAARRAMAVLGLVGMAATALVWWRVPYDSALAFHGGFLLASLGTAAVIAGVVHAPAGLPARLLSLPPLRYLGRISYGIYLWYWPVLLVMTSSRLHLSTWPLFGVRTAVTVWLAATSYSLVEQPIRQGAFRRWRGLVVAPLGAGLAMAAILAATVSPVVGTVATGSPVASISEPAGSQGTAAGVPVPSPATETAMAGKAGSGHTTAATAPSGKPVKVLLLGDSVAGSIGAGLAEVAPRYGIDLVNEGSPGCSVGMAQQIKVLWYTLSPGSPCQSDNSQGLFEQWRRWIDAFNPDVVVYVARGETFDQEVDGKWTNIGQPGYDGYLTRRFSEMVSVLGSRGAAVVLMTTPYYDSGTQSDGQPWPEDAPTRANEDNAIMSQVVRAAAGTLTAVGVGWEGSAPSSTTLAAAHHPSAVDLFDFGALMSPGGHYDAEVGGVQTRCADGVHFTPAAGQWLAPHLLPGLAALGRIHQRSDPGGAWPGPVPPAVPSWYTQMSC